MGSGWKTVVISAGIALAAGTAVALTAALVVAERDEATAVRQSAVTERERLELFQRREARELAAGAALARCRNLALHVDAALESPHDTDLSALPASIAGEVEQGKVAYREAYYGESTQQAIESFASEDPYFDEEIADAGRSVMFYTNWPSYADDLGRTILARAGC